MTFLMKRWYHSAKRDLGAGRSDPRGNLKALPFELVLSILDHVPAASILSFALTCRVFHESLCHRLSSIQTRKVKEEFLQVLEKELDDRYFCYWCLKLHRWNRLWRRRYAHRKRSRCLGTFQMMGPFSISRTIGYNHARLVMNRHLFGASHGLPLMVMEAVKGEITQNDISIWWTRKARILDNELFLLSKCTVTSSRGRLEALREFFNTQSSIRLCNHVWVTREFDDEFELAQTILMMLRAPVVADRMHPVPVSCPQCLTDFSMSVEWTRKEGWQVFISVYQQLGSCRSPHDWKWRAIGEDSVYNMPRGLLYPAGVARQRWLREERKTELGPRDEFLGTPVNLDAYVPGHRRCPWYSRDHRDHDCATYGEDDVS